MRSDFLTLRIYKVKVCLNTSLRYQDTFVKILTRSNLKSMKTKLLLLFSIFVTATSFSQTGNIRGVVTDDYGLYVPGANVMIESLNKGTITDENGAFTIYNVTKGTHEVTIQYLGFKNIKATVTVEAGKTLIADFILTESAEQLDDVVVRGYSLNSQAKALNTQRNKANITNIVSTDQIGKFPDANIGDAMRRIPGITMQVDQGESRDIIIRGLAPQLNSVTLN